MVLQLASAKRLAGTARARQVHRDLEAYLFLAPAFALILVFSFISVGISAVVSLTNWNTLSSDIAFVGLDNYRAVLNDRIFWKAARNTLVFVASTVPGITALALLLAVLANQIRRGRTWFRTIFYLPTVTPMVILSLLWVWMYTPTGAVNKVMLALGFPTFNWLMDVRTAMPAVIGMTIWHGVGYYMVIFLAGLADIPDEFYDAAKVDGASGWRSFRHITLPLMINPITFAVVLLTIHGFQVFTQVYVMTQGRPAHATEVLLAMIYRSAFQFLQMGYASAMSWLLFAVILGFSVVQLRLLRSQQLY